MKVKRYDLDPHRFGLCDMCDPEMEEKENGDWVLYDDVKHLLTEDSKS